MNDLRKMLDECKNKYVYMRQWDNHLAMVHGDDELIYRILSKMMDRIEAIELQNNGAEIKEGKK